MTGATAACACVDWFCSATTVCGSARSPTSTEVVLAVIAGVCSGAGRGVGCSDGATIAVGSACSSGRSTILVGCAGSSVGAVKANFFHALANLKKILGTEP